MLNKKNVCLVIILMLVSIAGCAQKTAPESFMRSEFNIGYIRSVAVLPFENIATDPTIAEHCRQLTVTQILSSRLFDVVDKMQVDSVLRSQAIVPGSPISVSTLRRLAQLLGVQGFIVASLDEARERQKGASVYLDLSLTMRLIDSESGQVVWQATGRENGYSLWGRLFGLESRDSFQVTQLLIENLLGTMGIQTDANQKDTKVQRWWEFYKK